MVAVSAYAVEWAAVEVPMSGHALSGDRCLVRPLVTGALAVVVDGLGHGKQAAASAARAMSAVSAYSEDMTVSDLVLHCHAALRSDSRGVVLSLAVYNAKLGMISWLGVGNVEGCLLLRTAGGRYLQEPLLLRPGIIGRELPSLQSSVMRVNRGDVLIFATDGISPDFANGVSIDAHVDNIARRIAADCNKHTDDALVLVMRCLGHAHAE